MKMTKLMEWVVCAGTLLGVWATFAFRLVDGIPIQYQRAALPVPIYLFIMFGIYSIALVLYRVATFNDCPDAAKELRAEIEEARKDLASKGFKFETKKST